MLIIFTIMLSIIYVISDKYLPECHYNAEAMIHKLIMENLTSVLGQDYDVLSLMDYVGMTMLSVVDFHAEYTLFQLEYGFSHKVTMNSDYW